MQAHGIQATAACLGGTSPVTVASLYQAHAQLDIGPANDLPGWDLHHSGKEAGALRGGLQADRQAGKQACEGAGERAAWLAHQRSMKQQSRGCSSETVHLLLPSLWTAHAGSCRSHLVRMAAGWFLRGRCTAMLCELRQHRSGWLWHVAPAAAQQQQKLVPRPTLPGWLTRAALPGGWAVNQCVRCGAVAQRHRGQLLRRAARVHRGGNCNPRSGVQGLM